MAEFVKKNNKRNNTMRFDKNNDYGTKNPNAGIPAPEVNAGTIEYKMSKKTPQEILCNYVNSELGLKGFCVKVLVDLQ